MKTIICKKTKLLRIKRLKPVSDTQDLREFVATQIKLLGRTAAK